MREIPLDARAERTRGALHRAFASLLLGNRYEDVKIADIAARAGVSRSTFYAHYSSKDALLAASIAGPFAVLADTLSADNFAAPRFVALLDHFWTNRATAGGVLVGAARRRTVEVLIRLIEDRLRLRGLHRRGALILPRRLAAVQLAEILLAPITAWLLGEVPCTAAVLAVALRQVSVAALESMMFHVRTGYCS
jgi:AcrR family transcriptional regulator